MTRQQILDKLGGAGTVLYPVLAALAIGGGSLLGQAGGGGGGDVASQVMSTGGLLAGQVGLQKLTGKGLYNPKVDPVEAGMDTFWYRTTQKLLHRRNFRGEESIR